jgi:histidine triad (HIT) family protein
MAVGLAVNTMTETRAQYGCYNGTMHITHAPENYICPICVALGGTENSNTLIHQSDIFYKDELVTGLINSFSLGGVIGNALIVPNKHFEHMYELPEKYGHRVFEILQRTAIAMRRAYPCDGITTLQCNEPAGWQHAFHYHHHVLQRYDDDDFMNKMLTKAVAPKAEKAAYAAKLQAALAASEAK